MPFKKHLTNINFNTSRARQVERKVMTHAAVAPGNPGVFEIGYSGKTGGDKLSQDHLVMRRKEKRELVN